MVRHEITNNLRFFEPVYGTSLNDLFENTCMLYYARKRSSAVNVFNEFKIESPVGKRLNELREKAKFEEVGK
jgi:hypothetical protein